MKIRLFFLAAASLCLAACGYKGDLYLPKEGDDAKFGAIQTGLKLKSSKEPTTRSSD